MQTCLALFFGERLRASRFLLGIRRGAPTLGFALGVTFGLGLPAVAQAPHPAITSWLRNTTGVRGRHYLLGNPTPIPDTAHANVQRVRYSATSVYINCSGVPAYVTGPYDAGNRATATNRRYLYKLPLAPQPQTAPRTATGLGHIGVFINGVPIYNYQDAQTYNNQGIWHRNAVKFENDGFDCARGHPSAVFNGPPGSGPPVAGNYHHHQNPSAFNAATVPLSTVCNVYLADGLYVPDSTQHGPLIGFAFDGYPVYGGYGYATPTAAGAIKRMTPGYRLRAITARTTLANGTQLPASQYGPTLATSALGYYGEDYEYVAGIGDLDEHNGRFCVTPDYPAGTYAYFATLDRAGNAVFPYLIGPTYYGVVETTNFPAMGPMTGTSPTTQVTVTGSVQTYTGPLALPAEAAAPTLTVAPNPAQGVVLVQVAVGGAVARRVELLEAGTGRLVQRQTLPPGATLVWFDTQALHGGTYLVRVEGVARPVRVVVE